jgi:hypothetical protein
VLPWHHAALFFMQRSAIAAVSNNRQVSSGSRPGPSPSVEQLHLFTCGIYKFKASERLFQPSRTTINVAQISMKCSWGIMLSITVLVHANFVAMICVNLHHRSRFCYLWNVYDLFGRFHAYLHVRKWNSESAAASPDCHAAKLFARQPVTP